jgi:hypothetical protein
MDRELELNSIDRYVKSSPAFVLEEHSHCEVPAGCGGVVLRWRNPATSVPVRLQVWVGGTGGSCRALLDGAPPASARPLVAPGRHAVLLRVEPGSEATTQVLFRAAVQVHNSREDGEQLSLDWRWTDVEPPPDAAARVGFDDAGWSEPAPGELPEETAKAYTPRSLLRAGAELMVVASAGRPFWMRAEFDVPEGSGRP